MSKQRTRQTQSIIVTTTNQNYQEQMPNKIHLRSSAFICVPFLKENNVH